MKMQQFDTTMFGEKHTVIAIDPGDSGMPITEPRIHRIGIIDRSGSMSSERKLDQACDRATEFPKTLKSGDLFSLYWFSGRGQYAPIVIGAQPSADISKIVDRYRYTVGLTVFSEVLSSVISAVKDHKNLVDQTVIDLLTDGSAVPETWSVEEEEKRAIDIVHSLRDDVSAVNTIGFGSYYNGEFLRKLSAQSEGGEFVHTSKMDEFKTVFEQNTASARSLVPRRFAVEALGSKILHVGSDSMTTADDQMTMHRLAASKNTFYIVLSKTTKDITINQGDGNVDVLVKDIKKLDKDDDDTVKTKFFFAYANSLYYEGDRRKALDIMVNNARDKYISDLMINAFTPDEIGITQAELRRAALHEYARYKQRKTPPGYLPARNALCVMDVFALLFDTIEPAFYLPYSERVPKYKRSGRKAESSENRFEIDFTNEIRSPVSDIVWNSERPNMSVLFRTPGHVRLNPLSAKNADLPDVVPSYIWRNHSFVVDGAINVSLAEFLVPKTVFRRMVDKKVPMTDLGAETVEDQTVEYQRVLINFEKLPVLNRGYAEADPDPDTIMRLVWRSVELDCQMKVIKHFFEELRKKSVEAKADGAFSGYNADQIRVLEEHGIRKDGSYGGILPKVAKTEESDFYEARAVEFSIAGFKTLPSINDFLTWVEPETAKKREEAAVAADPDKKPKKAKAINGPGQIMVDYYKKSILPKIDAATNDDGHTIDPVALREAFKKELGVLKAESRTIDMNLNVTKIGKILTHDGFRGFSTDAKGNSIWNSPDGKTLTLNAKRVKVYIDRPIEDLQEQADQEKEPVLEPVVSSQASLASAIATKV